MKARDAKLLSGTLTPLPAIGVSKWSQIAPFVALSREKWRLLALAGKAPQPIRMNDRCTLYNNAEVLRWIADPLGYTPVLVEQAAA